MKLQLNPNRHRHGITLIMLLVLFLLFLIMLGLLAWIIWQMIQNLPHNSLTADQWREVLDAVEEMLWQNVEQI